MRRICGWWTSIRPAAWDSRGHFFAAAAEAMRRILVENARRKKRLKRGGELQQVELTDIPVVAPEIHEDLMPSMRLLIG